VLVLGSSPLPPRLAFQNNSGTMVIYFRHLNARKHQKIKFFAIKGIKILEFFWDEKPMDFKFWMKKPIWMKIVVNRMKSHFTSKIQMNIEIVSFIIILYVASLASPQIWRENKKKLKSGIVENETVQDEMHDIILLQLNNETDGFQRERTFAEAQLKQVRL
jgi:hypothetical protein